MTIISILVTIIPEICLKKKWLVKIDCCKFYIGFSEEEVKKIDVSMTLKEARIMTIRYYYKHKKSHRNISKFTPLIFVLHF